MEETKQDAFNRAKEIMNLQEEKKIQESKDLKVELDTETKEDLVNTICSLLSDTNLSEYHITLFSSQLRNLERHPNGVRWPIEVIAHAIAIKLLSSEKVYNTAIRGDLSKNDNNKGFKNGMDSLGIPLPCWRTLQRWILDLKSKVGVQDKVISICFQGVKFNENGVVLGLIMHETGLNPKLLPNDSLQTLVGCKQTITYQEAPNIAEKLKNSKEKVFDLATNAMLTILVSPNKSVYSVASVHPTTKSTPDDVIFIKRKQISFYF